MSLSAKAVQSLEIAMASHSLGQEIATAINAGTGSGPFSSDVDATHLGFFGTSAVVIGSAFTQTYATASHTHANPTAVAVGTTASTSTTPFGYTQTQADAIVTNLNAAIVDLANCKQVINALIDDLQRFGLIA